MDEIDRRFYEDLIREDDVGLILLGQLHIEHQLIELCSALMPSAERCDWGLISFRAKVELAHGMGLSEGLKELFIKIGSIRNDFAHNLNAALTKKRVLDLYNALPEVVSGAVKATYHQHYKAPLCPSKVIARDLMVLILLSARQCAKVAVQLARQQG